MLYDITLLRDMRVLLLAMSCVTPCAPPAVREVAAVIRQLLLMPCYAALLMPLDAAIDCCAIYAHY